ncbi:MAG: bifunctional metallophosphatase/5'-nucleotidase [Bacteroidaceae bacterium]|nr:bifunctional metallophosphatase/5'-nucleotidase [Bacteroidaceae bacterium]
MKKWLFSLLGLAACFSGCKNINNTPDLPKSPIVIVYENDAHCAVDGYARLVALREEQRQITPYVSTVSCGDFIQGDLVGIASQGECIVDIMNHVGYDVITFGNHEFDYGIKQLFHLMDKMNASVVSANFRDVRTNKSVFPSYKIISYGDTDVAFIGFTTTTTPVNTSPNNYRDEEGNVIYDFSKVGFHEYAQSQIDAARAEGADFVIALSHLGDADNDDHLTSMSLIANTKGLDAVLDGHSHSLIPCRMVPNCEGDSILLTSTGQRFQNIGLLTIDTEGKISCSLNKPQAIDEATKVLVEGIKKNVVEPGAKVIATSDVRLVAEDFFGNRPVRQQEMPIGNLCADAFRQVLNTDVAMINGGGIRGNLRRGEVTFNQLLSIFPFRNIACTATLTGQQLADALECSVKSLPGSSGSFLQVSGLRFEVNTSIPSPAIFDENNIFTHVGDGPRRVSNIYIKEKGSDNYRPIDPERIYTLASFNYLIKELGGEGCLRYATLQEDNLGKDVNILAAYIEQNLKGHIGQPYEQAEGRITIK